MAAHNIPTYLEKGRPKQSSGPSHESKYEGITVKIAIKYEIL